VLGGEERILKMNLLKKSQTNWKYILIVIIFAIFVGGGILIWIKQQEVFLSELTEIAELSEIGQPREKYESKISDRDIVKIINEILPEECNKKEAQYYIQDLNGDKKKEVVIITCCFKPLSEKKNSYTPKDIEPQCPEVERGCIVVASLEEKGGYKKIGDLKTESIFRNAIMTPVISKFEDVDNDKQKEIFLSARGFAQYDFSEGVLDVNFKNQKLDWLKLKDEERNIQEAIFWRGSGATYSSNWDVEDVNQNGKKELIKIENWWHLEKTGDMKIAKTKQLEDGTWEVCSVKAYEWDGSFFSYSEELSKIILELKCDL